MISLWLSDWDLVRSLRVGLGAPVFCIYWVEASCHGPAAEILLDKAAILRWYLKNTENEGVDVQDMFTNIKFIVF